MNAHPVQLATTKPQPMKRVVISTRRNDTNPGIRQTCNRAVKQMKRVDGRNRTVIHVTANDNRIIRAVNGQIDKVLSKARLRIHEGDAVKRSP